MTFLLRASKSSLRRAVAGVCASAFTVFSLSPSLVLAAPGGPKKRVTKGAILLRTGPGKGHAARALLTEGRPLRVVNGKGQWVRVRLATGTEGWVRRDLLAKPAAPKSAAKKKKTLTASAAASAAKKKSMALAAAKAKKAAAAKKKSIKAVASAPKPQQQKKTIKTAAVIRRASGRSFIRRTNGVSVRPVPLRVATRPAALAVTPAPRTGTITIPVTAPVSNAAPSTAWTRLARVDATEREEKQAAAAQNPAINRSTTRGEAIVRRALAFRGTPYRRGASGRGGFDCSGFTSYLFKTAGSPIPRTAASQYHVGTPVTKGQLQAGDLVFFKNTYKRGISHVGVYVGNGSFVHASGTGRGVRVDSLSKAYYINHWAGARRPR